VGQRAIRSLSRNLNKDYLQRKLLCWVLRRVRHAVHSTGGLNELGIQLLPKTHATPWIAQPATTIMRSLPTAEAARRVQVLAPIPRLRAYSGPAILSYGFRPFFLLGALYAGLAILLWLPAFLGLIRVPNRDGTSRLARA
jgi:NnrS protein